MHETMEEAFESKGLKVILGKTKVMVSGGNTNIGMSKSIESNVRSVA